MLNLFKRFSSKAMVPMSQFTDDEKVKLAKVFLDPEVAEHFRWKRYPTNREVKFKGEATIVSWDNYKIGTGTIEDAKKIAIKEKLDLVFVHDTEKEKVVRIMNYRNWILRWAFRDKQMKTVEFIKKNTPVLQVSHKIAERDLDMRLKKIGEMLDKHQIVTIESKVANENSFEEIKSLRKFENMIQKKIRSKIEGKIVDIKVNSGDYSTRVNIRRVGKTEHFGNYNLSLNEPIDSTREFEGQELNLDDEEDEYMKKVLGDNTEMFRKIRNQPSEAVIESKQKIIDHIQRAANNDPYGDVEEDEDPMRKELQVIKQKITDLVGEELAEKFLKGRLKYKS